MHELSLHLHFALLLDLGIYIILLVMNKLELTLFLRRLGLLRKTDKSLPYEIWR